MLANLNQVTKNYASKEALTECTLELRAGEIVALLGPNGSGKTTLLKLISGLILPTRGNLQVLDRAPRAARQWVSYSSEGEDLYAWMTANDASRFMTGLFEDFRPEKFVELCNILEVANRKPFGEFSKGGRRRFKLAMMLARRARLFLMDEPFSGIDVLTREKILKAIRAGWDDNACLVLSTHEFEGAEEIINRVLFLKSGVLVGDKSVQEIHETGKTILDAYRQVFQ